MWRCCRGHGGAGFDHGPFRSSIGYASGTCVLVLALLMGAVAFTWTLLAGVQQLLFGAAAGR